MGRPRIEIEIGKRYGRLVVQGLEGKASSGELMWRCVCDCGSITHATGGRLTRGHTRSCQCLQRDTVKAMNRVLKYKHGHGDKRHRSRTYVSYRCMMQRCYYQGDISYFDYGGRGISVTKPWRDSFASFLNDMGERPPGTSLDRIDSRFGYFHANCRWATQKQQSENRRAKRSTSRYPTADLARLQREMRS
jgi:hypothetical protein